MLTLDHLAVLGETLEEAVGVIEATLGQPMLPGGKHAHFGTHNQVMGLADGLYLEAIATDPAAPPPETARWFGLDTFRGEARLDKWICRVPDMEAALEALPMAGRPVELSRGTLEWIMAVPEDGQLPYDGLFPALIQWLSPVPPGTTLNGSGWRLTGLEIRHPEARSLSRLLSPHLTDPRLRYVSDETPALEAVFEGASGERVL
ncbi:VOC family protein [Litorisediminicola beolgyonensis]|uniref:VOC family protein n=1 Tax=Litorisediminicola beolgyonensis TaxID=1173614 RepID=A0ABW3ZF61_9RHOB